MKLLSFIPAFSIFIIPASAQMSSEHLERLAQSILARQDGIRPASSAMAGKERVTGITCIDAYQQQDEITYTYYTDRGSRFDFAYMTYPEFYESDNPVFYPYSTGQANIMANSAEHLHRDAGYNTIYSRTQGFSYNDRGALASNNTYYYKPVKYELLYNEEEDRYYYNVNESEEQDDGLVAADSDSYVYNAGRLTAHYSLERDGKTWRKATRSAYEYDVRGRLITDSVYYYVRGGGWEAARLVHYAYYSGELLRSAESRVLIGDEWAQGERYDMDYYPDYRLRTISISSALGLRDSFVYTAAGTVQARYRFTRKEARWQLAQAYINTMDTKGAIDGTVELAPLPAGKGFDTVHVTMYSYTSYGNPERKTVYEKDSTTRVHYTGYNYETIGDDGTEYYPSDYRRYYYRDAYETTSLDAKLYPNPARDVVYIELPNDYYKANITVYDAVGGTIMAGAFAGGARMWLNVASLANGMYYYKVVADNNNTATGKFVMQR